MCRRKKIMNLFLYMKIVMEKRNLQFLEFCPKIWQPLTPWFNLNLFQSTRMLAINSMSIPGCAISFLQVDSQQRVKRNYFLLVLLFLYLAHACNKKLLRFGMNERWYWCRFSHPSVRVSYWRLIYERNVCACVCVCGCASFINSPCLYVCMCVKNRNVCLFY